MWRGLCWDQDYAETLNAVLLYPITLFLKNRSLSYFYLPLEKSLEIELSGMSVVIDKSAFLSLLGPYLLLCGNKELTSTIVLLWW